MTSPLLILENVRIPLQVSATQELLPVSGVSKHRGPGRNLEAVATGGDRRAVDGGFMMDSEASVSALVFHHPDCTYFSAGDRPDPSCQRYSAYYVLHCVRTRRLTLAKCGAAIIARRSRVFAERELARKLNNGRLIEEIVCALAGSELA